MWWRNLIFMVPGGLYWLHSLLVRMPPGGFCGAMLEVCVLQ